MNKYTIRTETETIYTDKVEVLKKKQFQHFLCICKGKPYSISYLKWR